MNDLQQEEIEVLKSMYMDDFHELNSESNPHFQIKVGSKLKKKKFLQKKNTYLTSFLMKNIQMNHQKSKFMKMKLKIITYLMSLWI